MENEPVKSNDGTNQAPVEQPATPAPTAELASTPDTKKTVEKITEVSSKTVTSTKSGPSAALLTIILGLITVMVLAGIYFYVQSTKTPAQVNDTAITPEATTATSPSPSASNTTIESEGAAIDTEIESIETGTKDIDAGLNDQQGDLSE